MYIYTHFLFLILIDTCIILYSINKKFQPGTFGILQNPSESIQLWDRQQRLAVLVTRSLHVDQCVSRPQHHLVRLRTTDVYITIHKA